MLALVRPITSLIPVSVQFHDMLGILLIVLVCPLAGLAVRTGPGLRVKNAFERAVLNKLPGYAVLRGLTGRIAGQAGEAAFAQRSEDRSRVYSHERETPAELSPEDLARFRRHKAAWAFFEACPPGARKRMLHVVTSAKKPETRAARLDRLIAACAEGRRLDVWTPDKNQ